MPRIPGRFGAVLTAMVTPFNDDESLDADGAATLARWLVANGNDGLVVAGTTGEAPVLSDAELGDLWRATSEAVTNPIVAGTSTNDTAHSVELTRLATDCGASGILAVTPYYSRPSQAGIEAHFRAIAEATTLPVIVYDIPIRTGRKIENATMLRLAHEVPNIVAVKDAAENPASAARLIAEVPAGFEHYSGDDSLTLPFMAVGSVGVISVAGHWCGALISEMAAAFAKGDVEHAIEINARMQPSFAFMNTEVTPNPVPAKAVLRALGLPAGQCRLPIGAAPDGLDERAREILAELGPDAPTRA